uniref:Beta-glucuronidase n=1 Tax=Bursaphelenchus xylophilus TaxID=6326 RepID=A0A1I7SAQ7_BURXY
MCRRSVGVVVCLIFSDVGVTGLLYPQQNSVRGLDSLDGLWDFVREPTFATDLGLKNRWYLKVLSSFENATKVPVPTAYNDLFAHREVRDHIGWYINGILLSTHTGGHLPFEVEMPKADEYIITVAVNNTLHTGSVPPGAYEYVPMKNVSFIWQKPGFDFFNYAGILRPVVVQVLGVAYLERLRLWSEKPNILKYDLKVNGKADVKILLTLFDPLGQKIESVTYPAKFTAVDDVQLWWPRGYGKANLYRVKVQLYWNETIVDEYTETFGFRFLEFKEKKLHVNGVPFYCMGFGMHEDFELHGRGFNPVVMTKDLNMFEWTNANCYRTSHYPYSEERAYEADRRGIMVITETPAVGLEFYTNEVLLLHKKMIKDMIERDFNHPSVFAWSLANEPWTEKPNCREHFQEVAKYAKNEDPTRPITVVYGPTNPNDDSTKTAEFADFIGINFYPGWYQDMGHPEVIPERTYDLILTWNKHFPNKPVLITEYGGEALPGMYSEPGFAGSEQYQMELIRGNFEAFEQLRGEGRIFGEMLWNFADFMTAPHITRLMGNHKGVFTRERQPKMAAYLMKERYGKFRTIYEEKLKINKM